MTIKVLAVDDEPDVLRLVTIKLKRAGFEVVTATNGEEAVKAAKAEQPDVVVLDWEMPKMSGVEALPILKTALDPAPLVLMLTARGVQADVIEGLATGADDYITKPFSPRELIARINVALIKAGKPAVMTDD